MVVVRVVRQPRSALGAQSRAVVLAHRLHRQCEHHRITQHGFEVEQAVLEEERVLVSSASSAGSAFGRPRSSASGYENISWKSASSSCSQRLQTPYALPLGGARAVPVTSTPFHDRLQAEVELHRRAFRHPDDSLDTEVLGGVDRAGQPLQRTRTPPQLVCVEHERGAVVEAGVQGIPAFDR